MKIKDYSKLTLSNPKLIAYMAKFNILQNKDIIFPHEETIEDNRITDAIIKKNTIITVKILVDLFIISILYQTRSMIHRTL